MPLKFRSEPFLPYPRYFISNEEGPDHDRIFTAEAYFGEELIGRGTGKNKKEAEQAAAAQAMASITD